MSSIFLEQITIFNFHLLIILEKVLEFSHSTLTSSCIKIKNYLLLSSTGGAKKSPQKGAQGAATIQPPEAAKFIQPLEAAKFRRGGGALFLLRLHNQINVSDVGLHE